MLIDFHDDDGPGFPLAGFDDTAEVLASLGIDAHHTPVDRFMGQPGAGLVMAWHMEHGDEAYPT